MALGRKSIRRQASFSQAGMPRPLDERGMIAIDALAERLRLTRQQLAETAGISRDAIYKPSRLESPKIQARLREVVEILDRVRDWAGGEPQALAWYRARPIPALGGRTAEALVKDGRATLVRDWLDAVAVGTFH
jgi:uncharacterized protein (DUF2384 family)